MKSFIFRFHCKRMKFLTLFIKILLENHEKLIYFKINIQGIKLTILHDMLIKMENKHFVHISFTTDICNHHCHKLVFFIALVFHILCQSDMSSVKMKINHWDAFLSITLEYNIHKILHQLRVKTFTCKILHNWWNHHYPHHRFLMIDRQFPKRFDLYP